MGKFTRFLSDRRAAPHRGRRALSALVVASLATTLAVAGVIGSAAPAGADTIGPIDFESYTQGSIDGQDGWTKTGPYDVAVSDNSTIPDAPVGFGAQSLRVSDAAVSSSFGDQ